MWGVGKLLLLVLITVFVRECEANLNNAQKVDVHLDHRVPAGECVTHAAQRITMVPHNVTQRER